MNSSLQSEFRGQSGENIQYSFNKLFFTGGKGHSFTFYLYLLGEISELGDAELPAVALSVVFLDLVQVGLEVSEPELLLRQAGVALAVVSLEPGELHLGAEAGGQAGGQEAGNDEQQHGEPHRRTG